MAKIELTDGTKLAVVKPNLWDVAAVQREMGWKAREYADWMKLAGMQTALSIFATLRRAGHDVTFSECAELDGVTRIVAEPGDIAQAEEAEGKEPVDPR